MRTFLLALSLASCIPAATAAAAPRSDPAPSRHLVELFTSEGCSSCPPADRLLGELSARGDVVALSFHVTYWDHLGWRDPYSSAAATDRQRAYARRFGLASLYTPQMVVDGREQFVGSNKAAAEHALSAASTPSGVALSLTRIASEGSAVSVAVHVGAAPADAELYVAWADDVHSTSPDRGENAGSRLAHHGVVRDLHRRDVGHDGLDVELRLTRPEAVPGSIVAWVQRRGSGAVLGITRTRVGPAVQASAGAR